MTTSQQQGTLDSFKQSSISRGTLHWQHRSAPSDTRAKIVNNVSNTKSVAFDTQDSYVRRPRNMASVLNHDRARSRRERTFVGGECAACEELLEHTLRGERVLQFSCGHVAHEACFYEYIKDSDSQYCPTCDAPLGLDSTRGGSILDLSKFETTLRWMATKLDQANSATWFAPLRTKMTPRQREAQQIRQCLGTDRLRGKTRVTMHRVG